MAHLIDEFPTTQDIEHLIKTAHTGILRQKLLTLPLLFQRSQLMLDIFCRYRIFFNKGIDEFPVTQYIEHLIKLAQVGILRQEPVIFLIFLPLIKSVLLHR